MGGAQYAHLFTSAHVIGERKAEQWRDEDADAAYLG